MGSPAAPPNRATPATARPWLARVAQRLLPSLVDLVFPPACVLCQRELERQSDAVLICQPCRQLCVDRRLSCRFCGAGVGEGIDPMNRCPHCLHDRFHFTSAVRLGSYEGPLKQAILAAKHGARAALAMHLGRLLTAVRGAELHALQCDAVVAVPAHWTRQSKHGHNSAEVLARQVAKQLGLPLAAPLVKRIRATRPQTALTPRERHANVKAAFTVQNHPDLRAAKLLLVDDVLTTGATANEVSKAFLAAGAASVAVAVLARAVGEK